jgi:hypothetical protein
LLAVSRALTRAWQRPDDEVLLRSWPSNLSDESLSQAAEEKPRGGKSRKRLSDNKVDDREASSANHPLGTPLRKGQRESPDSPMATALRSPEFFVGVCFVGSFSALLVCLCWLQSQVRSDRRRKSTQGSSIPGGAVEEEVEQKPNWNLDEDAYGLAIGILIRDTTAMAGGSTRHVLRTSRLLLVLMLVTMMLGIQVFLLLQVVRFVTPGAVQQIRRIYTRFEWEMHGSNISHVQRTATGLWVGHTEYYDPTLFKGIDADLKKSVCHIPLSQPLFLMSVLFIWSVTCFNDIRKSSEWWVALVVRLPVVPHLDDVMAPCAEEAPMRKVVRGLTLRLKIFISTFLLLPRVIFVVVLLWIGCRWLVATIDFGDLLMNAVALEFILLLKDLMYMALVPSKSRRDLLNTEIVPYPAEEAPSWGNFTASFAWALVALIWSLFYVYFAQMVLIGYRWDVRCVCTPWLESSVLD